MGLYTFYWQCKIDILKIWPKGGYVPLNIPKILCSVNVDSTDDTVSIAINKYKNHPNVKEIRNKTPISRKFAFQQVNREEVKLEIINLDPSKAAQEGYIPTRIIKANSDIISSFLHYNFNNNMLDKGIFPESFKNANIIPIFKKKSRTEKSNYRPPVSILPNLSKKI